MFLTSALPMPRPIGVAGVLETATGIETPKKQGGALWQKVTFLNLELFFDIVRHLVTSSFLLLMAMHFFYSRCKTETKGPIDVLEDVETAKACIYSTFDWIPSRFSTVLSSTVRELTETRLQMRSPGRSKSILSVVQSTTLRTLKSAPHPQKRPSTQRKRDDAKDGRCWLPRSRLFVR